MIDAIKYKSDNDTGERYIEYEFSDDATEWEKEAIREYGVRKKSEVPDALAWREAVDKLDDNVGRVMRGKDSETGDDVGRGRGRRGGQS